MYTTLDTTLANLREQYRALVPLPAKATPLARNQIDLAIDYLGNAIASVEAAINLARSGS